MIPLEVTALCARPCTILCLGAHCDDIEIGCGGTLLKWLEQSDRVTCRWVVFSGPDGRAEECRTSAAKFLQRAHGSQVDVLSFRDGFMPFEGARVKQEFERLKAQITPDVIFTHTGDDRHQDHRLIWDLTWNTFRDHLILEYEVPKYDGDLGRPNAYSPLEARYGREKVRLLMACYASQRGRTWFSEETFWSMLRLRGIECACESGYAEAFYARKVVLE